MGTESQASEVSPLGEDWGWLLEDSLRRPGCSAPPLRESRKKPGPAREARDRCWGVHEERGGPTIGAFFSMCSKAAGHCQHKLQGWGIYGCHLELQRQARTSVATVTVTNGPVSKCRSLPPPSWEPEQLTTAKGATIQSQLPWERTGHYPI